MEDFARATVVFENTHREKKKEAKWAGQGDPKA
jgi:hypothetical protein